MLKVVIADDEARVCRLIQMLGDWDALGMEVAGTAANGLEALKLIETLLPDILITDIRMPGCDGLELISRAKAITPQLEIVIISGYAEFEYAQAAISHGVGGYLLKPIKKEELMTTLEKLAFQCRQRSDSAVTIESLLSKNQNIQWQGLIEDMLVGKITAPTREQLARDYNFTLGDGCLQVLVIKADCDPDKSDRLQLSILRNKTEEICRSAVFPLCTLGFIYFKRSIGYCVLHYASENKEELRRLLRSLLNRLQAQTSIFGATDISLAIGGAVPTAENLPQSLREAQAASAERLVTADRRLFEVAPPPSQLDIQHLLEKYNRAISQAVASLSAPEADKAVDDLIISTQQTPGVRGSEIFDLVLSAGRMFALLIHKENDSPVNERFDERCEVCGTTDALFFSLRWFQKQNIERLWEEQKNEATRPIRLAKQFIGQHFSEPITLEAVCAATGFSVSYFSTMFKKETGEGFSKYLTRLRIEQAKSLLQDTNLSVSEICERVGYNDLKHFTTTFKKSTNLNPGQYRKLYG